WRELTKPPRLGDAAQQPARLLLEEDPQTGLRQTRTAQLQADAIGTGGDSQHRQALRSPALTLGQKAEQFALHEVPQTLLHVLQGSALLTDRAGVLAALGAAELAMNPRQGPRVKARLEEPPHRLAMMPDRHRFQHALLI